MVEGCTTNLRYLPERQSKNSHQNRLLTNSQIHKILENFKKNSEENFKRHIVAFESLFA
eukprot:UN04506